MPKRTCECIFLRCTVRKKKYTHDAHYKVASKAYVDLKSLITDLNTFLELHHLKVNLLANDFTEIVTTCKACDSIHEIWLSQMMLSVLGFPVGENIIIIKTDEKISGSYPGDIMNSLPQEAFIYTSVCEPYIVGNVQTSLLRSFPLRYKKGKFGELQNMVFGTPNYIPLLTNSFRTIEIDIRDRFGESLAFEAGRSSAILHFRRVD